MDIDTNLHVRSSTVFQHDTGTYPVTRCYTPKCLEAARRYNDTHVIHRECELYNSSYAYSCRAAELALNEVLLFLPSKDSIITERTDILMLEFFSARNCLVDGVPVDSLLAYPCCMYRDSVNIGDFFIVSEKYGRLGPLRLWKTSCPQWHLARTGSEDIPLPSVLRIPATRILLCNQYRMESVIRKLKASGHQWKKFRI